RVSLSIKAFDAGSFEITMILAEAQGLLDSTMDFLTGRPVSAAGGLSVLTGAVWTPLKAVKWLAGRKVKGARDIDSGTVELIADDDTTFRMPRSALSLVRDVEYRRTVTDVVRPLGREGIEELRVVDTELRVSLTPDDLRSFDPP